MRLLLITLVTLVLGACTPQETPVTVTEAERQGISETVIAAQSAIFDVCGNLVVETCFQPFVDDATWVNEGKVYDLQDVKRLWVDYAAANEFQSWVDREFEVTVFTPELAMITTSAQWFKVDTTGVSSDTMAYAASNIWKKIDGTWKSTYIHESIPG